MKVIILLLMVLPLTAWSQGAVDERLYEVFDADYLERLQTENPFLIKYYTFCLDNSYRIETLPSDKTTDLKEVIIPDLGNMNILKILGEQQLQRASDYDVFYKIKGTDKVLVVIAGKKILENLQKT